MPECKAVETPTYENSYNQFITALDMAQLKKVAAGIRRIDFDKPKSTYMKLYDDFIQCEVPEIKKNVKMRWVRDVIDSRLYALSTAMCGNWNAPKQLLKEFEKHAEYIEKLSNAWKQS